MFPRLLLGQSVTTPKVLVTGGELVASSEGRPRTRRPPATTPRQRENQLIASAIDLAEKQIADGTATSQVLTHFLKLGSGREELERDKLRQENKLLQAKVCLLYTSDAADDLLCV